MMQPAVPDRPRPGSFPTPLVVASGRHRIAAHNLSDLHRPHTDIETCGTSSGASSPWRAAAGHAWRWGCAPRLWATTHTSFLSSPASSLISPATRAARSCRQHSPLRTIRWRLEMENACSAWRAQISLAQRLRGGSALHLDGVSF